MPVFEPSPEAPLSSPASSRLAGRWRWVVFAAYLALIFTGSAQSTLPSLPGHPSDKLLHGAAYAVMALLFVWAATSGRWRDVRLTTALGAVAFCALYGWSDEFHQLFVPNRQYDLKDLAADASGAAVAAGASWAWGIIARGRDGDHGV